MAVISFIKDVLRRIDWKVDFIVWVEFFLLLAVYPILKLANPVWFVENGIVENLQILLLIVMFFVAINAKYERKFFIFCALLIIFLIMRETNTGRGYFCEKYLAADVPCRWKNLKYGYFVDVGRVLFGIFVFVYAIYNKLWKSFKRFAVEAPVYIWDIGVVFLGGILGTVAEFQSVDNEILEECGEFLAYFGMICCIWRYEHCFEK